MQIAENNLTNVGYDTDKKGDGNDYQHRSLMKPNNSGCTALHYACQYASPEVVWEITRLYPEAVSVTDSEGLTTLHYICMSDRFTNAEHDDFFKTVMLLEIDPTLVKKNQHVLSPIALHCRKYKMEMEQLIKGKEISEQTKFSLEECWRQLILIAYFLTNENDKKTHEMLQRIHDPAEFSEFSFLHLLLKVSNQNNASESLIDVLLVILKLYPEQAQMTDISGNLPLHNVLVNHRIYPSDKLLLLIQALLTAYPHAAKCKDSNGKLPFHLAEKSELKMNDGLRNIINAYPEVVVNSPTFSENEKLLPLVLSVSGDGSLNLSFELLTAQTYLIRKAMVRD